MVSLRTWLAYGASMALLAHAPAREPTFGSSQRASAGATAWRDAGRSPGGDADSSEARASRSVERRLIGMTLDEAMQQLGSTSVRRTGLNSDTSYCIEVGNLTSGRTLYYCTIIDDRIAAFHKERQRAPGALTAVAAERSADTPPVPAQ